MEFDLIFWEYPPLVKYTNHKAKVIINLDVATLALGSWPRPKGCKGAGQEKVQESHHILPGV